DQNSPKTYTREELVIL
ncbi:hypothetical protein CP082626L3_0896B, partial [Chlamydia psittaci 08-2626_L3]